MKKVKVVVTDYIEPDLEWEREQCEQLGIDFFAYQRKMAPPDEIVEIAADADILVVNMAKITRAVLERLPRTGLIIRHGIGYDNVDVQAATEHNILVANIPDYCVPEVAEQALMLMMACQRKLSQQEKIMLQSSAAGRWDFLSINPIYRLQGKTVGIVGIGRIGSTVFKLLQGFDVKFVVADPYISEQRQRELSIACCSLENVLRQADVVTIHVPLNSETYYMFDEPQFKMMKETAILINTSRGSVVNLAALDRALRNGDLAFAGVDVYENEPPPPDFPLLHNNKAICTPHLSWLSEESGETIRVKIIDDIRLFLQGKSPHSPVNPEVAGIKNGFLKWDVRYD